MKLIVGLGNPGKKYENTRHNIGFMFIDEIAKANNLVFTLDKQKQCLISFDIKNNEKIILIKPQTYMNLSGESVIKVVNYYDVDINDILVIHDDLDLKTGKLRFKTGGSSGGHNGIKNIIENIGCEQFKRLKIGIDKKEDIIDYVLGKFTKTEMNLINDSLNQANDIYDDYLTKSFDKVMSKYN